jgi:O-antigen/teichoic acid export membrane protein
MKSNMGATDRIVRIIIAAVVAILFFTDVIYGTWGIILMTLAGILLLTSFMSLCPLYLPLNLSTAKKKNKTDG